MTKKKSKRQRRAEKRNIVHSWSWTAILSETQSREFENYFEELTCFRWATIKKSNGKISVTYSNEIFADHFRDSLKDGLLHIKKWDKYFQEVDYLA